MEREKDWKGNSNAVFSTLGASNHSSTERQSRDFYATDPASVRALMEVESYSSRIWEPACGMGHISQTIMEDNPSIVVKETDIEPLVPSGERMDFLTYAGLRFDGDIITNPPYAKALEFVRKALDVVRYGHKVAMLLRIQFLEGMARRELFDTTPPVRVYVFSKRQVCAKNGDFDKSPKAGSAQCYAWFVWQKGTKKDPVIKWL